MLFSSSSSSLMERWSNLCANTQPIHAIYFSLLFQVIFLNLTVSETINCGQKKYENICKEYERTEER